MAQLVPWTMILSGLALLLGELACAPQQTRTPLPAPRQEQSAPAASRRDKVSPPAPSPQTIPQGEIEEIVQVLQKIRKLPLHQPIRARWVDRAFLRRFIEQELATELQGPSRQDYLAGYLSMLTILGLLPPGYDYLREMRELATEQIAGLYDPRSKQLYLPQGIPASEVVLSHEITHALQDQSYDLQTFLTGGTDQDPLPDEDTSFARHALGEGDATLSMMLYVRATMSPWNAIKYAFSSIQLMTMDTDKLTKAPLYIRERLLRSYIDGMIFVERLKAVGGWEKVNHAYVQPPRSSEQILHPGKYLSAEPPVPIVFPDLGPVLPPSWKLLHENTLGEIGVRLFLQAHACREKSAKRAAAGWGGDRVRSYRRGDGQVLLLWSIAWDTARDAHEFATELVSLVDKKQQLKYRRGAVRFWQTAGGSLMGMKRGKKNILLLFGVPHLMQGKQIVDRF